MFTDLNVFQTAHALAVHAGQRQAIVAQNVANADTPGYRARDVAAFEQFKTSDGDGDGHGMHASRPRHLNASVNGGLSWETMVPIAAADPNGNTVSIEEEMLKGVDIKRQHDRALAIYKTSLSIIRTSLGRI